MILIHCWARTRGSELNAKCPTAEWWNELIPLLNKPVKQILWGNETKLNCQHVENPKLEEIEKLLDECETFICIDSFLQHLNHGRNKKKGIVVWSKSDPKIFGWPENINILKYPEKLRSDQFLWWANEKWENIFPTSQEVVEAYKTLN